MIANIKQLMHCRLLLFCAKVRTYQLCGGGSKGQKFSNNLNNLNNINK